DRARAGHLHPLAERNVVGEIVAETLAGVVGAHRAGLQTWRSEIVRIVGSGACPGALALVAGPPEHLPSAGDSPAEIDAVRLVLLPPIRVERIEVACRTGRRRDAAGVNL